jgi:pimeloyl-ACP methyl ester carboxylesterase
MILSASVEGIVGALETMRDRVDSGPLLRNIAVPTMVLAGADDQLIPVAASRTIAAGIADSTLEVVAGAGHLVPIEAPDAFIAAFNRFLARLQ